MGNNQSNTKATKYKKIEISSKKEYTTTNPTKFNLVELDSNLTFHIVRFGLCDHVNYEDGSSNLINFYISKKGEFDQINEGDYLELDLDEINKVEADFKFFYPNILKGAERRNSNGSIFKILFDTNEYLGWQLQERERLLAAREYGQWAYQTTQAWTSHNLPPQ